MDRRAFLAVCSAAGMQILAHRHGESEVCCAADDDSLAQIFPSPPPIKKLFVAPLSKSAGFDETTLLTTFQGLINRTEVRVYFVQDDTDRFWLDYYRDRYGIAYSMVDSPYDLVEKFSSELNGFVVYDPNLLDTANVATVMGSIDTLVPAAPSFVSRLRGIGLDEHENLVGRWKDRYTAYRWAHKKLFSKCNKRLIGTMCVDTPLWPSEDVWLRDYLAAHKIFTVDLSANLRDRADLKLLERVFQSAKDPGCVVGWRCARCNEHELVALAARNGLSMLCCLGTRNLTVHSAIPRRAEPFVQSHGTPTSIGDVERKVYISFMATDGDATSSMLNLQAGRFRDPEHGSIPFSWGFLPAACDLMPGVAACNYERKTDNDYFVAPSSGALYTYPYLHPKPEVYLRMSRRSMRQADLRVAYMINWVDDFWWQEMDLPKFAPMLRKELPDCIGFARGQGESPFEKQYIGDGTPYVFCGEGIHRDSDVGATFAEFIVANPIRPLFIYCLTNHSVSLGRIKQGLDQLAKDDVRLVRLDEFLLLANKAHELGWIPKDDFYPDKTGLKRLLQKEGRERWMETHKRVAAHAKRARLSQSDMRKLVDDAMLAVILSRSDTSPADVVAYDAVWDSMSLAKAALNIKGVYVNNKAQVVHDFMREFDGMEEIAIVQDLWDIWLKWRGHKVNYDTARTLALRLERLVDRLPIALPL